MRRRPRPASGKPPAFRRLPAVPAILWQVHGCAACCAFGAAAGSVRVIGELHFHVGGLRCAVALAGIAVAAGVLLGLWLPRRMLRRRLDRSGRKPALLDHNVDAERTAGHAVASAADPEFAALLAGLLILGLGVLWAAVIGLVWFMEGYRAVLTQRFLHPPWLTRGLLCAPVVFGTAALGAGGAVVSITLHGWHQLVGRRGSRVGTLWATILGGAALGAWLAAMMERPASLNVATLLPTFAAGALAVYRRSTATGVQSEPPLDELAARPLRGPLAMIGAVAACAAATLIASLPTDHGAAGAPALELGILMTAALGGVLLARGVSGRWSGVRVPAPSVLLAIAILCALSARWPAGSDAVRLGRLALAGSVSAACVASVGGRVIAAIGRVQPALARLGTAIASGTGIGLALASLPALGASVSSDAGAPARLSSQPVVRAGRGMLQQMGLRTTLVDSGAGPGGEMRRAWDIDLGSPRWDVVILARQPDAPPAAWLAPGAARRLLRRCQRATLDGGRVVIELPADDLTTAAFRLELGGGHLLRVTHGNERYEALVFGRDAAAWLQEQPDPPGFSVERVAVRERSELNRIRAAATTAP